MVLGCCPGTGAHDRPQRVFYNRPPKKKSGISESYRHLESILIGSYLETVLIGGASGVALWHAPWHVISHGITLFLVHDIALEHGHKIGDHLPIASGDVPSHPINGSPMLRKSLLC